MWRLLLILSLVLQPLALLRLDCSGSHGQTTAMVLGGCCSSAGCCTLAPPNQHPTVCCSGAAVCNCGEQQRERPAPPPSRSNTLDQFLVVLQLSTVALPDVDDFGSAVRLPANPDVLLPAMAAPQAFFCVWLT